MKRMVRLLLATGSARRNDPLLGPPLFPHGKAGAKVEDTLVPTRLSKQMAIVGKGRLEWAYVRL